MSMTPNSNSFSKTVIVKNDNYNVGQSPKNPFKKMVFTMGNTFEYHML